MAATLFRSSSRTWKSSASNRLVDPRLASTLSRKASMLWPLSPVKHTFHFLTVRSTYTIGEFRLRIDELSTPDAEVLRDFLSRECSPLFPGSGTVDGLWLSSRYHLRSRGLVQGQTGRVMANVRFLETYMVPLLFRPFFFHPSARYCSLCWAFFSQRHIFLHQIFTELHKCLGHHEFHA